MALHVAHQIWDLQQTSHPMMVYRPQGIGLEVHSTALSYWQVSHLLVRLRATVRQTWDLLQTDLQMRVHTLTVDQPTAQYRLLLMALHVAHQIWDLQQTSHPMMVYRPQGIGLEVHSTALSYWPVSHLLVRLRATVLQTWDVLQTDLQMQVHTLTVDQPTAQYRLLLMALQVAHQIWDLQQTSHPMMVYRPQGIGLEVHSTALSYWPVSHLLVRLRATVLQTWDMLQTDFQMRVHTLTVDQPTATDRLLVKVALMDPVRVDHWKVMVLRTWGML